MIETICRDNNPLDPALLEKVPARAASRLGLIPLYRRRDGSVAAAALDLSNVSATEDLSVLVQAPVHALPVSREEFERLLQNYYGFGAVSLDSVEPSAVASFADDLIRRALRDRATDIHLEPYEGELTLRFRIDGILHPLPLPSALSRHRKALLSRLKVMAQMNIAEKRLPQDGRIRFKDGTEEIDIRVSTLPTIHGESLDLRLLPSTKTVLGLSQLGMAPDQLEMLSRLIKKPNGILLATGPTGHGKTTTLYAALSQINTPDRKIITIEDPVEIRMKGVNQIQVHSKIGLSFAAGLRSMLRQDPDVIMVGEIRDQETADIAIRSSLTGHLVFSTLHTNDAAGAVTRLLDVGVEPYLVASSLNGILAQRLVRLLCSACKTRPEKGCVECRSTGFRGRTGLFELLVVDEEIRALIMRRASSKEITRKAMEKGMRTLYLDGRLKVTAGATSEEEVLRVTEEAA